MRIDAVVSLFTKGLPSPQFRQLRMKPPTLDLLMKAHFTSPHRRAGTSGLFTPSTNSGGINQLLDLARKWAHSDCFRHKWLSTDTPQTMFQPAMLPGHLVATAPVENVSPDVWRAELWGSHPRKKFLKKLLLPCRSPPVFAIFVYWKDALATMMPDTFLPFCTTFLTSQLAALHKCLLHTSSLCSHTFPWWKTGNEVSVRGPWKSCSAQSNSLGLRWDMGSASPLLVWGLFPVSSRMTATLNSQTPRVGMNEALTLASLSVRSIPGTHSCLCHQGQGAGVEHGRKTESPTLPAVPVWAA